MSAVARAVRGLRLRVAAAAAAAAAIALLVTGVAIVASVGGGERTALDATLTARVDRAATVARDALAGPGGGGPAGGTRGPGAASGAGPAGGGAAAPGPADAGPGGASGPRLLGPADQRLGDEVAIVRIVSGGDVLERLGSVADPGLPLRASLTPRTVDAGGQPWRILQRPVDGGVAVQAAAPLQPLRERAGRLRERVLVAGLAGVLATALLAFLLVGPALRAVGRLRRSAAGVAATADLRTRVDERDGPVELRELAATLNAMLARLERADAERRRALEATRRFAADAGHELRTPLATIGAGVQTVAEHPDLEPAERTAALVDVLDEHRRAVALLEALQALARGDGAGRLEREPTDLVELAEAVVAAARTAAPAHEVVLDAPERLVRDLWAPGVRLALENLVRNAVVHGRDGGRIAVAVRRDPDADRLVVDDDGPGVPEGERAAVRERFARGAAARAPGSGLGLALVEQQAELHGGALELGASPAGGLRATLVLPRSSAA